MSEKVETRIALGAPRRSSPNSPSPSTSYAALTAAKRAAAAARVPALALGPQRSGCASKAARRKAAFTSSGDADRGRPRVAYGSASGEEERMRAVRGRVRAP